MATSMRAGMAQRGAAIAPGRAAGFNRRLAMLPRVRSGLQCCWGAQGQPRRPPYGAVGAGSPQLAPDTTPSQAAAAELVIPSTKLVTPKYCESINQTKRRPTRTINVSRRAGNGGQRRPAAVARRAAHARALRAGALLREAAAFRRALIMLPPSPPHPQIGPVKIGSEHKVALQTMTTTDTRDIAATVAQVKRCADAGADIVRITVQGRKEAEACMKIREQLFKDG